MNCSVCIATYKRPELLKLLFDSLILQELTEEIKLEIIVVNNDIAESAKPIFEQYFDTDKISFNYYVQPLRNISVTRNMGVQSASGDYIFFIDDDEIASPSWIRLLLETMHKYNADAVFGRVLSHFDDSTPSWIKKSYIFNRPSPPTGTITFHPRTGNCLIKASIIKQIEGPFDPGYGVTGGEDTYLFSKLKKRGYNFVNCREAWVSELQPLSRTKTIYLIKRAFFTGNLYTRRTIELFNKNHFLIRIIFFSKSIFLLMLSILLMILCLPNGHFRSYWMSKIASNLGHIFGVFKIKIKVYK
jgi:succinoglycan biosynthesis protein ExoM